MKNEKFEDLAEQVGIAIFGDAAFMYNKNNVLDSNVLKKFAKTIIYDFLDELTNDDSLGAARIETIKRLAEKWGVARDECK